MRYFLVSYYHHNLIKHSQGFGYTYFQNENYPGINTIKNYIEDQETNIIIINITEFQSAQDYKDFVSDTPTSETEETKEEKFEKYTNSIYEFLKDRFNFSKEIVDISLEKHHKTLQEYFNEGIDIVTVVENIFKIKIEE